ncbi:MAG TPA: hypothetical protein ENF84_03695 [Chloroflexi bacterium]|nr:hypothetical protein [Chloroflexota bacterium]
MAKTLTIEVAPQIHPILERLKGDTPSQKIAFLISSELRRYLEECEREMLELEIKYGMDYEQFKEKLERGELGDEFSYELEKDAIRWEDLIAEKKHWLDHLRAIERLLQ